MISFIEYLSRSAPKAKQVDLSFGFIIVVGIALAAFYFVKKNLRKVFKNIDEQLENLITIAVSIGILALGFWLTNL